MRGFQPNKKANCYADGGLVDGFKMAFGLKQRMRDTPEYQQMMRSQQPAQQAPAQTTPAMAKAKPAISQYAGNDALKRRMQEADSYANGGMVRGKGTGTSDEIQDEVPDGTYIMPADTTKTVGADRLRKLGNGNVPVNLSNGEFKMPPEQVHAVGVQALNQIKDATHTPVPRGLPAGAMQSKDPQMFFANGGSVDKKRLYLAGAGVVTQDRLEEEGMTPQQKAVQPTAGGNDMQRWQDGANMVRESRERMAASKALSQQTPPPEAISQPPAQAGFSYADNFKSAQADAKRSWDSGERAEGYTKSLAAIVGRATNPLIDGAMSFGSGVKGAARGLFGIEKGADAPAAPAAPAPAIVDTAPPKTGEEPLAGVAADAVANTAGAAAADPAGKQIQPGVYQHGRGQFSDSPDSMGFGNFTGQPNAQNMNAAGALSDRYGSEIRGMAALGMNQPQTQQINAPTVLSSANDWASRNALRNMGVSANSIMNRPGGASGSVSGGRGRNRQQPQASDPTGAVAQYNAAVSADLQKQGMQPQADIAAMKENSALQREGIQQNGANARSADQNSIERQKLEMLAGKNAEDSQVRGFDIRQAQRKEGILSQYDKATTPEAREALAAQYPDMFGAKNGKDNFMAVGGGQEWDQQAGAMRNVPQRLVDLRTGRDVGQGAQQPQLPPGMTKVVGKSGDKIVYEDANGNRVVAK